MLYLDCPTCGTLLGNKQLPYMKKIQDIENNTKLSDTEKNTAKSKVLDELKLINTCCRMRMMSFFDWHKVMI